MTIRTRLQATADRLWVRFASVTLAATYRRFSGGSYNPTTGEVGDGYVESSIAVILERWRQDQIDGQVVKAGDRIAKVRGRELGFEPSADDQIVIARAPGVQLQELQLSESGAPLVLVDDGDPLWFGLEVGQSQLWNVMRYSSDPAGIVFDVHVRAHQ